MIEKTIARRYARALFLLAQEQNQLEDIASQVQAFAELLESDSRLFEILADRFIDLNARKKVVSEIAQKINLNKDVLCFLHLLIHKGRMQLFFEVVSLFEQLVLDGLGKVKARIVSAVELKRDSMEQIEEFVKQKTGKKVIAAFEVDPHLIGGVAVEFEGSYYDGSVRNDLNRLSQKLAQTINL